MVALVGAAHELILEAEGADDLRRAGDEGDDSVLHRAVSAGERSNREQGGRRVATLRASRVGIMGSRGLIGVFLRLRARRQPVMTHTIRSGRAALSPVAKAGARPWMLWMP